MEPIYVPPISAASIGLGTLGIRLAMSTEFMAGHMIELIVAMGNIGAAWELPKTGPSQRSLAWSDGVSWASYRNHGVHCAIIIKIQGGPRPASSLGLAVLVYIEGKPSVWNPKWEYICITTHNTLRYPSQANPRPIPIWTDHDAAHLICALLWGELDKINIPWPIVRWIQNNSI